MKREFQRYIYKIDPDAKEKEDNIKDYEIFVGQNLVDMTYKDEKNPNIKAKYQQFKENNKGSAQETGLTFHER